MNENLEDIISISDEDGNEFELLILDEAEMNGVRYLALTESKEPENEANIEVIILKQYIDESTGETMLSTVDSDDELEKIYQVFEDRMFEEEDSADDDED